MRDNTAMSASCSSGIDGPQKEPLKNDAFSSAYNHPLVRNCKPIADKAYTAIQYKYCDERTF
jgi:hypothetical protein